MRGGCTRRIDSSTWHAARLALGRVARYVWSMGHRPFGGAPGGDVQCAGRSQVAVALSAVAGCDRFTVPVLGASCRGPYGLAVLKRSTMGIVEE
jgi:hypothetical protein